MRWIHTITVLPLFLSLSCHDDKQQEQAPPVDTNAAPPVAVLAKDMSYSDWVEQRTRPMKENVKRIEAIQDWTSVNTVNTGGASTEEDYAKYFYRDGTLEKVVSVQMGETGQEVTEYYLLNGKLSFVMEREYTSAASGDNDSEDFEKDPETEGTKTYFEDGKVLVQVLPDCGAPNDKEFEQKEGERLQHNFDRLMEILLKKPADRKLR